MYNTTSHEAEGFVIQPSSNVKHIQSILNDLCAIDAVSGREEAIAAYVEKRLAAVSDDITVDTMQNVICRFTWSSDADNGANGTPDAAPVRIMLTAHSDEIGLLVQWIEESGALRVLPVGGVDIRTLLGKQVTIHGKETIPGIVGTVPPHLSKPSERNRTPSWDDVMIDTGLPADRVREIVRPGDFIAFHGRLQPLMNNRVTGKALDNRAGLAAVILAYERLASLRHGQQAQRTSPDAPKLSHAPDGASAAQSSESSPQAVEIVLVASSQEEIGYRGITTAAASVNPHVALVVDVGFADTPGIAERRSITMGAGPSIAIGANLHPGVVDALERTAQQQNIPVQKEVLPARTGTDAWAVQTSGTGVPTGLLSIPLRNMHSSVEIVQLDDVDATEQLLTACCREWAEKGIDAIRRWHHG